VRAARPPVVLRGEWVTSAARMVGALGTSLVDAFTGAAIASGASVTVCSRDEVGRVIEGAVAGARSVLSFADGIPSHHAPAGDLHDLADLDALVCEPELGVAENGAVWIASSSDRLRAALFLAARVVTGGRVGTTPFLLEETTGRSSCSPEFSYRSIPPGQTKLPRIKTDG